MAIPCMEFFTTAGFVTHFVIFMTLRDEQWRGKMGASLSIPWCYQDLEKEQLLEWRGSKSLQREGASVNIRRRLGYDRGDCRRAGISLLLY